MLLLLRRALAQLRGDPPESWPNALRAEQPAPGAPYGPEWYGPVYPIPTLTLPRLLPGLGADATKARLRQILTQLQNANIGTAWRSLSACCAARKRRPNDEGLEVLLTFIEALVRINLFNSALAKHAATRIQESSRELAA